MRQKTFLLAASLLLGGSMLFAEKPEAAEKTAAETGDTVLATEQSHATHAVVSRALSAIPLSRSSSGPRILPFIDSEGQPIAAGKPLLAFQILPFIDGQGNLIPILKTGPAILPFLDASGEPIPIGKPRSIEPLVQ